MEAINFQNENRLFLLKIVRRELQVITLYFINVKTFETIIMVRLKKTDKNIALNPDENTTILISNSDCGI